MRGIELIASAACLLGLAGCLASATPAWDAQFGDSSRILKAQQLIDPGAPARNAQAGAPTDGRTTREAMQRHADSYREPPPTSVVNIGVGGGGTGR